MSIPPPPGRRGELRRNRFPIWIWLLIALGLALVVGAILQPLVKQEKRLKAPTAFFQVTNRQFLPFLWNHPDLFQKGLENFSDGRPGPLLIDPKLADQPVQAPPALLFRYHTWERLLGGVVPNRPLMAGELRAFLAQAPEWLPAHWQEAPSPYAALVESLSQMEAREDLAGYSLLALPQKVRRAFYSWKALFTEREKVASIRPLWGEMDAFLEEYSLYKRPLWRNITPNYLKSGAHAERDRAIPNEEIPYFLRAAFYYWSLSLPGVQNPSS